MRKAGEEKKSPQKLLDIKNIFIAVILVILMLSLLTNYLTLGKLSSISDDLRSQDQQPVLEGSESVISEQGQKLILKIYPQLDKIRHLQRQIANREVVKDDELIGVSIDNKILDDIKEYNELVPRLKGFFADQAIKTMIALSELENNDGRIYAHDYMEIPSDIRKYAEIITDLSLYRNCTELLRSDSRLAYIIYSEGGGSAGMWPYFWHTEYIRDNEGIKEDLNRLFDLVEGIITALDKECENLFIAG